MQLEMGILFVSLVEESMDYLYSYDKTQFIERGYSARLNYRDMTRKIDN
jgi:hypothetical protein